MAVRKSSLEIPSATKIETDDIDGYGLLNLDQSYVPDPMTVFNPAYVEDGQHKAVYLSRSRLEDGSFETDTVSEFKFQRNGWLDEAATVSFSYRYQNWGKGTAQEGDVSYSALFQLNYVLASGGALSIVDANYALKDELLNDGSWHTLTISIKDIAEQESLSSFVGVGFKFADFRGYIMVSDLKYETSSGSSLD